MEEDIDEELEILTDLSVPERYEPIDRYRDFRAVFLETEGGRRVLRQIMSWGHILRTSVSAVAKSGAIDPNRVMLNEGERRLSLRIFDTMLREPPATRPDKQAKTETEN